MARRERPYAAMDDAELDDLFEAACRIARGRKQTQAKLASGEWTDIAPGDVQRDAFHGLMRKVTSTVEPDEASQAADEAYRAQQTAKYREQYGWEEGNPNDDASLAALLSFELELKSLEVDLRRPSMTPRARSEARDNLRELTRSHMQLQRELGIDRVKRVEESKNEDVMTVLRQQIESGAHYRDKLVTEWAELAPTIRDPDELIGRAIHHSGMPQEWVVALVRQVITLSGGTLPRTAYES